MDLCQGCQWTLPQPQSNQRGIEIYFKYLRHRDLIMPQSNQRGIEMAVLRHRSPATTLPQSNQRGIEIRDFLDLLEARPGLNRTSVGLK